MAGPTPQQLIVVAVVFCLLLTVLSPSSSSVTRMFSNRHGHGERGITDRVVTLLPHGHTFVEMGANDGVNSNSNWLESIGWTGLCIEAGPSNYKLLEKNRPKCTNINAVVSNKESSTIFREFPSGDLYGHSGLHDFRTDAEWDKLMREHNSPPFVDHEVRTSTLSKIFKEQSYTSIDYFSLDVEGAELAILNLYPFEEVPVRVWTIESNKLDRNELVTFMEKKGYWCEHHYDNVNTICGSKVHL
ncbi:hypothetical protein TrLO_g5354 [Triparma laevis f. longispina]|uniref:Methyltransferase FkbM domain-containing protein n=1 Tax=Triparma laevis f. longispina TaxID=1714387 RepID=A0A9W7KYL7_9STRA|nr:hypothetical protein TrLO_g5354 [Triparma laevis f. longispina]